MTNALVTRSRLFRRGWMVAPALFWVAAAFAQQPAGVHNFHIVNNQIYRGAQPTAQGFRSLAKMGVKTVVDLRAEDGNAQLEKQQVEADGMKFVNIPMHGLERPSPQAIAKVLALFDDPSAGPVFVHCRRGADRTGTVVACYRISHDHWDNEKALREAKSFGMAWIQWSMQHFVQGYKPPVQNASSAAAGASNN